MTTRRCVSFFLAFFVLFTFTSIQASPIEHSHNESLPERSKRFLIFGLGGDREEGNTLPTVYLGEVNLDDWPECQSYLEVPILKCQQNYHNQLYDRILFRFSRNRRLTTGQAVKKLIDGGEDENNENIHPSLADLKYDRNSDYIKHASCCGMWKARQCVVQAVLDLPPHRAKHCPIDLIDRYRALPVESNIKANVLDYCSEFGDGAPICQVGWNSTTSITPLPLCFILFAALIAQFV